MKNNRIPHESLQPRYLDGMILYARDINEIISVLVAGVNQNKFDMDKILMGSSNSVVVYKESALEDITANEGDYATLFRYGDEESIEDGDTLSLYRYKDENWEYLRDLSFIDMATTIDKILVEIEDIKEGANKGLVFDTLSELEVWVSGSIIRPDGVLPSDLKIGQNIFILERYVPDYWVKRTPVTSITDLEPVEVDNVWDKTIISLTAPNKPNNIWLDTNPDLEIILTEPLYVPDYNPEPIKVFTVEDTGDVLEDLVLPEDEFIVPEGEPEPLEINSGLIIPEYEPEKLKE